MADRPRAATARPHRYALVAAAEVITDSSVRRPLSNNDGMMLPWQERSWEFYDQVGEYQFGVSWIANALSRVNLGSARPPAVVGEEPTLLDVNDEGDVTATERRAAELVEMIAGGAAGQGQLLSEYAEHLTVAGFGWLVAEPDLYDDDAAEYTTWCVLAQDALRVVSQGDKQRIEVRIGSGSSGDAWRPLHPNALVVKTWRRHARRPWEPASAVQSVLGVLEIIELLTAHLTATGRSRLAGAGLLAIPAEAEFPPPPVEEGDDPQNVTDQDRFDHFVEQLAKAMTTPIRDRDNASAVVPLPLAIPGDYVDKLKHLTFATPFDERLEDLLTQNIKRLALGLDMPPEVLTGMAGVNHWTAWQVEETAITMHVEPLAEIVCNALTEGFLRPALKAEGLDADAAMVWYSTKDLTTPPDKSQNAVTVYDKLQISGTALRRETGFTEDDKPDEDEFRERVLLDVAKGAPTLAPKMLAEAGYLDPEVGEAADEAASVPQAPPQDAESDEPDTPAAEGPPDANDRPSGDRAALDSAVLMACDGIVSRALERAGMKLRGAVGKSAGVGADTITVTDVTTLHTVYDPTVYADLDQLLDGSFARVPTVAEYLGLDADALEQTLNAYLRGLLAAQHEHDLIRLSSALGADVMV